MDRRGRCSVCRAFGPVDRTRDFLCDQCADPAKIICTCRGCGGRITLAPESATLAALRTLSPDLPNRLGIAIAVSTCASCRSGDPPPGGQIEFFGIAPDSME
ncbi:hypothetical protein HY480_04305 [Candidatus Uhrbacteria bacterium]|nr:hypothetical protein [Candidatus Uhrbacteria bacterium]